jgi:hypothetical protein
VDHWHTPDELGKRLLHVGQKVVSRSGKGLAIWVIQPSSDNPNLAKVSVTLVEN